MIKKTFIVILGITAAILLMTLTVSIETNSGFFDVSVQEAVADSGCYLNAYQRPGEMCFICTTRESSNNCTTPCGSEVCWEIPGEG